MDFFRIMTRPKKNGVEEMYVDFHPGEHGGLMTQGHAFYAVWDKDRNMWSRDESDVVRVIDKAFSEAYSKASAEKPDSAIQVNWTASYSSSTWKTYKAYVKDRPDWFVPLDSKVTFKDEKVSMSDYVSKRLPYSLSDGPIDAYEELASTLYSPEERRKFEWGIGSIFAGDSKTIQKFFVFYGSAGSGKSTILNLMQMLFEGYYAIFNAKSLGSNNDQFAMGSFKGNPLLAIQHDGDLSRIEDNSKLNSIISHEEMLINEKFKTPYIDRINAMLFMATNRPVKITDAKSGIIRRLIDINPSGNKVPRDRYDELMDRVKFELGAIAKHCLDVYLFFGRNYYDGYRPMEMMYKTDPFFNFVEDAYPLFSQQDGCSLKQAYDLYKEYCNDSSMSYVLRKYQFREELKNYFRHFYDRGRDDDGKQVKNIYRGFLREKFISDTIEARDSGESERLVLDKTESIFDSDCAECPAQYADAYDKPTMKWANVKTVLRSLKTDRVHYVKIPENHIVIDFDLKDENGDKSAELNLREAAKFPPTYAEFSKGGAGVHLHYIYDGNPTKLSRVYSDGIEIKVFNGNSSLRRRLSYCNDHEIAHISSGLPLKGDKVINFTAVKSERGLRALVEKNLRKEVHPGTKPSVDFIYKILDDAYRGGLKYDLTDMRPAVLAFANNSSHQSEYCIQLVSKMHFKSEEQSEGSEAYSHDDRLVFFDVEVFPNLFLVNWKYEGSDTNCVRMINPTPQEIEGLFQMKLVGFNCRRYDNHILYARYLGYSNIELYNLSQRIVTGSRNAMFGEAYNISYTDVYDFSTKKQSLKKFEIELGIHHQELGLPWDEPVDEKLWPKVAEYCDNDVIATEAVFNARKGDFVAREILADLAGMDVNTPTNTLTARIIFGNDRNPKLVYTDLATGKQW